MTEIVTLLEQIHALEGMDHAHLQQLAAMAQCVEYPRGAVIFREGDPASDVYLVVEGQVGLEICAPTMGCRRILTVSDGELLGWSPVLDPGQLTATARALTPTRLVSFNGRQVLTYCEHDPRFGYEFMRRVALALAARLSATRLQLVNVYGSDMPVTPPQSGPRHP